MTATAEIQTGRNTVWRYLTKPINFPELEARVRSMLRIKKLQDEIELKNRELFEQLSAGFQIIWNSLTYGAVTGTYNRQYLLNHLEHIIDNVDEKQHSCLFYIELDEFSERI